MISGVVNIATESTYYHWVGYHCHDNKCHGLGNIATNNTYFQMDWLTFPQPSHDSVLAHHDLLAISSLLTLTIVLNVLVCPCHPSL